MKNYSPKNFCGFYIVVAVGQKFLSPQNSYLEILVPSYMVLGRTLEVIGWSLHE